MYLLPSHPQAQKKKGEPARDATLTVTGAVAWRRPGIKYKKNELYMDTIEQVNVQMSSNGEQVWWYRCLRRCKPQSTCFQCTFRPQPAQALPLM